MQEVLRKNKLKLQNKIYVCGDSFSSVDSNWSKFHWSERLQKLLPEYNVVNLSYAGATNLSIAAQVEKALKDQQLKFVVLNASDIYRIDVPNNSRKTKSDSIVVSKNEKFNYNDFKKVVEKIYTEIYKNSFVTLENFYDLFAQNYSPDYQYKKNAVLSSFGMWSLTNELFDKNKENFPDNVLDSAINYFKFIFDLNVRFNTDLGLIEGKIYKLQSRGIPFLYNLGGLVNKKSFLNRVFPHVIQQVEDDFKALEKFSSKINLFDIEEDSFLTDNTSPGFHISSDVVHQEIAEYYKKRILELNAS
jgi:hypothetical protein